MFILIKIDWTIFIELYSKNNDGEKRSGNFSAENMSPHYKNKKHMFNLFFKKKFEFLVSLSYLIILTLLTLSKLLNIIFFI